MSEWKYNTVEKLRAAEYKFHGWGVCRFCAAKIQWWFTKKRKLMPIDATSVSENCDPQVTPHFASCPNWPGRIAEKIRRDDKEFLRSLGVKQSAPGEQMELML